MPRLTNVPDQNKQKPQINKVPEIYARILFFF